MYRREGYSVGVSRQPHVDFVEYYDVKSSKKAAIKFAKNRIELLLESARS